MTARWEQISEWANRFGWTHGAELGVSDGRNLREIASRCPGIELLIGVDTWDESTPQGKTLSKEWCRCPTCVYVKSGRKKMTMGERRQSAQDVARDYANVLLWRGHTAEIGRKWMACDGSLDFVFVDADHSIEGVDADIKAWRRHLKPTGWMIGHDWLMSSVRAGVLLNYSADEVREADDHMWYVPGNG